MRLGTFFKVPKSKRENIDLNKHMLEKKTKKDKKIMSKIASYCTGEQTPIEEEDEESF